MQLYKLWNIHPTIGSLFKDPSLQPADANISAVFSVYVLFMCISQLTTWAELLIECKTN